MLFLVVAAFFVRKDRILYIPFILLVYSNINGLLDWEDFALKGYIKFQDYGLVVVIFILSWRLLSLKGKEPPYIKIARSTVLYNTISTYWLYLIGLFFLSVAIQGAVWSIKMARVFFYGLILYVLYQEMMVNPIEKFNRLFRAMLWITIFFGFLYVIYNVLDVQIYPKAPQEVFAGSFIDRDVKRNFSGFPTFAHFFIFYLVDRLLRNEGMWIINLLGLLLLMSCVVFMLTRYTMAITIACAAVLIIYRHYDVKTIGRLVLWAAVIVALLPIFIYFNELHFSALIKRFEEIGSAGILNSHNSRVRIAEFEMILSNVLDFNPFSGFGFVLPWFFGYQSSQYHAGSADNGYANLLGITGFIGLAIFAVMIVSWLVVNRRLRAMNVENLSRVTFVFLIFVMLGMMNSANAGYLHYFGIFMIYDLLAYSYFKYEKKVSVA
jgi:hypothetical protein